MDEAEYCHRIALIDAGHLVAIGSPNELREHNLGGNLFELVCAPPGAALAALREAPEVIDAAIFGDRLHVLMHPGVPETVLQPFLAGRHIEFIAVRAIRASLEDVFVQLVTHADKGVHSP
jgi:ABC-2 type transport system ATP-binding protein